MALTEASKLTTHVRLGRATAESLAKLKAAERLGSIDAAVAWLIQQTQQSNEDNPLTEIRKRLEALKLSNDGEALSKIRSELETLISTLTGGASPYLTATFESVIASTIPAILCGLPGSGKTYFARQLYSLVPGPGLVFDPNGEYAGLPNVHVISLAQFFGLNFEKDTRKLVLVPSSNIEISRREIDLVIGHLFQFQHQLADWILIFEECHRFAQNTNLKSFVAEARKFTRKTIVISPQPDAFVGLGELFLPPEWNGVGPKVVSVSYKENA